MSDLPVVIRELRDTDIPLILDSWVNSVRYSTPAFWWVPNGICKSIYREMLTLVVSNRPELFRVLVNEDDEDQIFGWVCGDARVTHFVFIKREFRDMGLAALLIDVRRRGKGWVFSHWTQDCERIGRIEYKPSKFRELINGISKTVGDKPAGQDKPIGQGSQRREDQQHREAVDQAVGMVS